MGGRRRLIRGMLTAAMLLAAVAAGGVGLVALIQQLTTDRIEARQAEQTLQQLEAVLPAGHYTNNPAEDVRRVRDTRLGTEQPLPVYRARRNGEPAALVLTVIAPDGYSGPIELLVAVDTAGEVLGVRVVDHAETPGLGDAIEARRSDWIDGFRGRSLGDPPRDQWTVRRDGGAFDQFTGATITPRAVTRAVARALDYHREHGDALFQDASEDH
ncbi:electron transport complex subunit RsxG [Aquisalimonas sp.]|uniref:electron transport complex subunit RsxG n=1 Tax=Aquisalimonas sp. TaxID=1872621 RepID=UPI0025C182DE|nr:electron transport complex subunit RsxG [Aquisalimonas sp.]